MANNIKYPAYEIGTTIKTKDVDLKIIDIKKERSVKTGKIDSYYRYKCNKCGFDCGEHYYKEELRQEYWVEKRTFNKNPHCICCGSKQSSVVVPNINSIVATDAWMIPFFQGGYDEAKKYSRTCAKKINPICPHCGIVSRTQVNIYNICNRKGISCKHCGDGIPYPERFTHSLLSILGVEYISQFSKVNVEWCKDYRYDFYFEYKNIKYIIEVNGDQHYTKAKGCWGELEDIQQNDNKKHVLAIKNGIDLNNYIIIDCRKSDFNYIKQNVLTSKLAEIFDLKNIDWRKVEEMSLKNIIKHICDLYNKGYTNSKIIKETGLSDSTVRRYLKKGSKIGLCDYDSSEYHKKLSKSIAIYKNNILLDTYSSIAKLCKMSKQKYGVRIDSIHIRKCIKGEISDYKGFTFKYL